MPPIDAEQLAILWVKSQPQIAGYISSLVRDFHDADDILQNVAAVVVRKREEYDPQRPFAPWAISVARLEVLKHRRTQARDRLQLDLHTIDELTAAYQDATTWLDDRRGALRDCLEKVEGRPREALLLRYLHSLKPVEIADRLNVSANAVNVMLHRTRKALQDCIERFLRREESTS